MVRDSAYMRFASNAELACRTMRASSKVARLILLEEAYSKSRYNAWKPGEEAFSDPRSPQPMQ
jgi:hypothetical protein